jgi:hypothetical protein
MRGLEVEAANDSKVLVDIIQPYFDRTYKHFCSHRQSPSTGEVGNPGIVQNGRTIYFAHPIFTQYNQNAPRWCKTLFLNAIDMLLPQPLVRHSGPSTVLLTVNEQAPDNRWVLHLLHYIPERRGQDFDVLEDVIPLFDVRVSVKAPRTIAHVISVPDGQVLDHTRVDGRTEFTLPRLDGHQMIALVFD